MMKKIELLRKKYPDAKVCSGVEVCNAEGVGSLFYIEVEIYSDKNSENLLAKYKTICFEQSQLKAETEAAISLCLDMAGYGTDIPDEATPKTEKKLERAIKAKKKENDTEPSEEIALTFGEANMPNAADKDIFIRTKEDAKKYQVTSGYHKGKYIGELMAIDKKAVEFFATKYQGSDANLRTAARIALGYEDEVDF